MSWMKRFGHLATYLPVFMAKLPTTFSPACLVLRSTLRNNARSVWVYVDPPQEDSYFFWLNRRIPGAYSCRTPTMP